MKFRIKGQEYLQDVPMINTWGFVEQFYHGYDGSEKITLSNDLACFASGDYTRKHFLEYHYKCPKTRLAAQKAVEILDREIYAEANAHFIEDILSGKYILVDSE